MSQVPDLDELTAEIAGLLRTGVTAENLRQCKTLLRLEIVQAKAASTKHLDLAVAASTTVKEAALRVDDCDAYGAANSLLGLAPGSRGTLLKERRRKAAEALHVAPETFRKEREDGLVEAVTDELFAADSAYRFRHRHRKEAEREPEQTRLGIDWLEQHRSYRRIWTPITGMRNDLAVLRGYLAADEEDQPAIADRLANVSWQYARFQLGLQRFIEEQGGLWLLADIDSEIAAAEAVYKLTLLVPLGEADSSWLRTLLIQAPHEELEGFSDLLIAAGERRRELMGAWLRWTGCLEADDANCGCDYHTWQRAADEFIGLIDADWYRVADWYREPLQQD